MAQRQKAVVDDQELKSRIIARYSYVDKDDDVREHRPVGPKSVSIRDCYVFVSVHITVIFTKEQCCGVLNFVLRGALLNFST
jgi:hypothetical protein